MDFTKLITDLIGNIITTAMEGLQYALLNLSTMVLCIERSNWQGTTAAAVDALVSIFFGFGVSVIILRTLKKGFETYVLWTDGDPDADPILLLTNFFKAIAISVAFPTIYSIIFVPIVMNLINMVLGTITGTASDINVAQAISLAVKSINVFSGMVILIFVILYVVLYIQFIIKGVEMLVLRIGVPFACAGILDSDNGIWAPYAKKFIQSAMTVVTQLALTQLGFMIIITGDPLIAVACLIAALSVPKLLQEFLIAGGGGGIGGAVSTGVRVADTITRIIK